MQNRQREIIRTGYIGIFTNILVATGKAVVGMFSGSMAIVLDAVNNMTDAFSSAIAIVGVKLAGRPADDSHPFGYGRIEYFTAVIIATIILVAGGTSLTESIKSIFSPSVQEYSVVGLCLIGVTVVVKYFLGIYTRRKGRELGSDSLVSSGTECLFDCLVSLATLLSAALLFWFDLSVDSWLAVVISCIIIKAGLDMLMSPVRELLGKRSDPLLIDGIKKAVGKLDGVRGVYDVVIHDYGPEQKIGALHVEVDDTMSAAGMHHLTRRIQKAVHRDFGILVTVGFYARHREGTEAAREERRIREHVMQMDGVMGMHGFYINKEERIVSFDVVYSFRVKNPLAIRRQLAEWLRGIYEDYDINIGLDRNFSG